MASKIIKNIPKMKMRDMMGLWQNALKYSSDKESVNKRQQGREVLDAIGKEWRRRRGRSLEEDLADIFDWPSTMANSGLGDINTSRWLKEGMFKFMGYHVGETEGLIQRRRQEILSEIFNGELPPVFPKSYLNEWGDPKSPVRLRKMAETIAAFIRNAKRRRDAGMARSINDWSEDLRFLYLEYYLEKFGFGWPDADE